MHRAAVTMPAFVFHAGDGSQLVICPPCLAAINALLSTLVVW